MNQAFLLCLLILAASLLNKGHTQTISEKSANNFLLEVIKTARQKKEALEKGDNTLINYLQVKERNVRRKLRRSSMSTPPGLSNDTAFYTQLKSTIYDTLGNLQSGNDGKYNPIIDTLRVTLQYIQQQKNNSPEITRLTNEATSQLKKLDHQLVLSDKISGVVQGRKEALINNLSSAGAFKEIKKLNNSFSIQTEKLARYKQLFNHPTRCINEVLRTVSKLPAFAKFMNKHSVLAGLFGSAQNPGTLDNSSLEGLQSRLAVQNQMARQGSISPAGNIAVMNQQLPAGVNPSIVKDKINQLDISKDNKNTPGQGDHQQGKTFGNRLQFGANIQFNKSTTFLPSSADWGISMGYKLSNSMIIGVGGAYKMGMGREIQHMQITHQGLSCRSFLEFKIKRGFSAKGGYEKNLLSSFKTIEDLKNKLWQSSGLLGITKKTGGGHKFNPAVEFYFDFLSFQNTPRTSPFIFRMGCDLQSKKRN